MTEVAKQESGDRYSKELPSDRTYLAQAWKLFEIYSKIPASEIDAHVSEVVGNTNLTSSSDRRSYRIKNHCQCATTPLPRYLT